MLSRLFLALALLLGGTGLSRAVHVVMCGGPALRQWEGLRIQPDRHDNWWANFVRASTIRIAQIQQQDPAARITWIVYRPGYATRGKEDGKPYTRWIADLASKYKIRLVWVNSADQAIRAQFDRKGADVVGGNLAVFRAAREAARRETGAR